MASEPLDGVPARHRIDTLDLAAICEALSDHDDLMTWWFDPTTGEVLPSDPDWSGDEDGEDLEERGCVLIEPIGSRDAYGDMERFADAVSDPGSRDRLQRALAGRGAFRRFRDTIHDLPRLTDRWRRYRVLCEELRAIEWLVDHDLVDLSEAEDAARARGKQANAILDELLHERGPVVELAEVPSRWPEIERWLESGVAVTLTRGSQPVATIEPRR